MEPDLKLLMYISYFSVLVPIFIFLAKKQNFKAPFLRVFFILLITGLLSDLIGYISIKAGGSNIVVGNIYILAQFFLLSYFYCLLLKRKGLIYIAWVIFAACFMVNIIYFQPFNEYQGFTHSAGGILLMVCAVVCYFQTIRGPLTDDWLDDMKLWMNIGVLFYFFMTMYVFISANYIFKNESEDIAMMAWGFHNVCNIIKNMLFAKAIYHAGKRPVYIPS
jgi:hypothetical protein